MSDLRQTYEDPLWLLLGLAGMVLLIACANLANLMLARASAREKEMGIRLAIGATRGRLIRQLLVESLLLSFVGAGLGVFLARVLGQLLVSLLSTQQDPLFVDFSHNSHVLAFTAGLALLTCVLFGLTPALRATQVSPGAVLKASGRGITAGRGRFGLRRALVVSQIALSLVLLVGSLLFARSLRNLLTVDAGFREDGILITNVDFSHLHVPAENRVGFKKDLLDRVRAIPGVLSAADAEIVPISGDGENRTMFTDGSTGQVEKFSTVDRVSPGFFATLGTPLLEGRDFGEQDTPHSPLVAVVNQAFADKFFNGADPVGKTFHIEEASGKPQPAYEIVGLVRNAKYYDLREEFGSIAYLPLAQRERQDQGDQFMIRSDMPLTGLIAAVKGAVGQANPDIEVDFQAFHTLIRDSLLRERLMATLSGFFGLLAAILATVGVYGVISYMVARRRNEIGIRMALGANRVSIVMMIMNEAAVLLAIGLALGAVLSLAGARAANALLFGLRPHDPTTLLLGIVILASAAAAASYLPARRAASLDPMAALRDE
jgi:predicted permease